MDLVLSLRNWLESSELSIASLEVDGDGRHFNATIVSPDFSGQSRLARHRMVYEILGDKVGQELHALSLKTLAPEEYEHNESI